MKRKPTPAEQIKAWADIATRSYTDAAGVIRWKSNDRVPFDDLLETAGIHAETRELCRVARDADTKAFFAEYRANYRGPSDEELAEMRAAFGAGETVVDVITGTKVKL